MRKILSVIFMTMLFISLHIVIANAEEVETYGNLRYVAYDDYVEIVAYTGEPTEIEIPSEIDGLPVTSIWGGDRFAPYGAFYNCKSLTSVSVPDTMKNIGAGAFRSCSNLSVINLPDSVNFIGENAFINTDIQNNNDNWQDISLYIGNHLIAVDKSISENFTVKDGTICIAGAAFDSCADLTSVYLPDSVISIGDIAFSSCNNLTTINMSANIKKIGYYAFSGCSSLQNIVLPDGITDIDYGAFWGCSSLRSVTIPDSITDIKKWTFEKCSSLMNITIPDSVTNIGYYVFDQTRYYDDTDNWHDGILYIGKHLIKANEDILGECTINDGTICIAESAFNNCKNLTAININNELINIGNNAFYGCSSLSDVNIPNGVVRIGDDAFHSCTGLIDITIPSSVLIIGNHADETGYYGVGYTAFYDCDSLTNITVDENNPNYMSDNGILFNKDKTELLAYPANKDLVVYEIPNGVIGIGSNIFRKCKNLTSVKIPDSATYIEQYAFNQSDNLLTVNIPDNITRIGTDAFSWCSSLYNIVIPDSVTEIGYGAFRYCTNLKSAVLPDDLTNISGETFSQCSNLSAVNIPKSLTVIPRQMFWGCSSLVNVTIPETITGIEGMAFANCSSITNIDIPESVTFIDFAAFVNCNSLTNIKLPYGLTGYNDLSTYGKQVPCISYTAFEGCTNLTSIEIPASVINIGTQAFSYCDSLTDIYFGGSKEQWEHVNIERGNSSLDNATVHFGSDKTPILSTSTALISQQGNTYNCGLTISNVPYKCPVMAALYDIDGKLAGVGIENIFPTDDEVNVSVTADNAKVARIFIWDSLNGMKPLCEAQEITIE